MQTNILYNNNNSMRKRGILNSIKKEFVKNRELYLLVLPGILYYIIFKYLPIYGIQIAFRKFTPGLGIWESPWVGFDHFVRFFKSYNLLRLLKNTFGLGIYLIIVGFPAPIILALAMNEIKSKLFKRTIQTATYLPHFISVVVLVGMTITLLHPSTGIVNNIIKEFGGKPIWFMIEPNWFKTIFVFTFIWQNAGWGSIIYMAALAGIDKQLYEAAVIDGANKIARLIYIIIPSIIPTIVIMFLLRIGNVLTVGYQKALLMQNALTMETADVIQTYVFRSGLIGMEYSFSAAVGFFNSVINVIFLLVFNSIARKFSDTSLW